MRNYIRSIALVLSILSLIMVAACSKTEESTVVEETKTIEEIEAELGVSYDNVIIQYTSAPVFVYDPWESFYTNITVYADNTVVLWTGDYVDGSEKMSVMQTDKPIKITEKQKQSLIDTIREKEIIKLGDCSDDDVLDGSVMYLYLFDAEGNIAYECGGANPWSNENFNEVSDILYYIVGREAHDDIEKSTCELNVKFSMDTSFETTICTVLQDTIYDSLWVGYTFYADNRVEIKGLSSLSRKENLLADMEPITIYITDEETEKLKNCILTEMRNDTNSRPWQDTDFFDNYEDDLTDYDTVVQYYDKSGWKSYYCSDYDAVSPLEYTFIFEVLGFDNYIRYASQVCEEYYKVQGKNISLDDVLCYYVREPYTTNKEGEKIAVKYTLYNETATLKIAVGPVSDVKGERDIVSREYPWDENYVWGPWRTHTWAAQNAVHEESQPDYENLGAHIGFFDSNGNLTSYIAENGDINDMFLESMGTCFLSEFMEADIEEMKAEAEKLM